MAGLPVHDSLPILLGLVLGTIGAVQLAGPRFVQDAYERWDYPRRVRVITGGLDIIAAIMLVLPGTRAWGIALAGLLTFGSVVILLNHRQYLHALPAIGLMLALLPASITVPRAERLLFVVERETATGSEARQSTEPSGAEPSANAASRGFRPDEVIAENTR